jgi:hypothetical protein
MNLLPLVGRTKTSAHPEDEDADQSENPCCDDLQRGREPRNGADVGDARERVTEPLVGRKEVRFEVSSG